MLCFDRNACEFLVMAPILLIDEMPNSIYADLNCLNFCLFIMVLTFVCTLIVLYRHETCDINLMTIVLASESRWEIVLAIKVI